MHDDPDIQFLNDWAPDLPALSDSPIISVSGAIGDYRGMLSAPERAEVARATPKRQLEFAAGRYFAQRALTALGLTPTPITRGPDRGPRWPEAVLGSISHASDLAWVVAARRDTGAVIGLGVDVENLGRVSHRIERLVLTTAERVAAAGDTRLATLIFCAKEAIYKATRPLAGAYIGFQAVEVTLDPAQRQFTARYLGEHPPSAILNEGTGFLRCSADHAQAVFVIPADTCR